MLLREAAREPPGIGAGRMRRKRHLFAAVVAALALAQAIPAMAQKPGGVLRVYHRDSPSSMSILEEATLSVLMPVMGVFNNLVVYDQHVAQNSLASIHPELATEWSWNEDRTELIFRLRRDECARRRRYRQLAPAHAFPPRLRAHLSSQTSSIRLPL